MDYTHEINRIERGKTKGSGSPMWRCKTVDGQSVNVFQHSNPARDTYNLMFNAGYADIMIMEEGEVRNWTQHPIKVVLVKDGEWWKLDDVEPRAAGAEPDAVVMPDVAAYRDRAQRHAKMLVDKRWQVSFFDTESTGLQDDDEMVSAAVITAKGLVLYNELLLPQHPEKLWRPGKNMQCAAEVNGITPEQLTNCAMVEDALVSLAMILTGRVWVAYNASFDVGLLERECLRYKHPLIYSLGIHDAMKLVSEYVGEWNPTRNQFQYFSLGAAASMLDVEVEMAHSACADAKTTLELLRAIANGAPVKSSGDIPF